MYQYMLRTKHLQGCGIYPEITNHSENGVFPAQVHAWFILSDQARCLAGISRQTQLPRRGILTDAKQGDIERWSLSGCWTALKRPLHTICQECKRLHCKKAPTKGSKRTQQPAAMKVGRKMQQTHRGHFFPPSTEEDGSILSTHTHSSQ